LQTSKPRSRISNASLSKSAKYWKMQNKKRPRRDLNNPNAAHLEVVQAVHMIEITRRATERETVEKTILLREEIVAKSAREAKILIQDMRHKCREILGEGVRNGSKLIPARKIICLSRSLNLTLLKLIDLDLPPRMIEPRTITAQMIGIEKERLREKLTAIV